MLKKITALAMSLVMAVSILPTTAFALSPPHFDLRNGNGLIEAGAEFNYEAPVKNGYSFFGWSTEIDSRANIVPRGGDGIYTADDFEYGHKYYAVWEKDSHLVYTRPIDLSTATSLSGEGWSWDYAGKKLTIDNLYMSIEDSGTAAAIKLPDSASVVVFAGSSNAIEVSAELNTEQPTGIMSTGTLSISGKGSLSIAAYNPLRVATSLSVEDGTISCTGVQGVTASTGNITLSGGKMTVITSGTSSSGLTAGSSEGSVGKITVTGGTLEIQSAGSYGMTAFANPTSVDLKGGTVKISSAGTAVCGKNGVNIGGDSLNLTVSGTTGIVSTAGKISIAESGTVIVDADTPVAGTSIEVAGGYYNKDLSSTYIAAKHVCVADKTYGYVVLRKSDVPAAEEGYDMDCAKATITAEDGYELSKDIDFSEPADELSEIQPETDYYIRKAASTGYAASDPAVIETPARPAAPADTAFTANQESQLLKCDGAIKGVSDTYEYRVIQSTGEEGEWTVGSGEDISGLRDQIVEIRVKATKENFAGESLSFAFVPSEDATEIKETVAKVVTTGAKVVIIAGATKIASNVVKELYTAYKNGDLEKAKEEIEQYISDVASGKKTVQDIRNDVKEQITDAKEQFTDSVAEKINSKKNESIGTRVWNALTGKKTTDTSTTTTNKTEDTTTQKDTNKANTNSNTAVVESAKTGDAGIIIYGLLSASSVLGMGWIGKKKFHI